MLKPYDILFGYQHYWWPSLKYPALLLSLDQDVNVLSKSHAALLLKLGVMKTFPIIIRTSPTFLGGLNLYQLEVEAIAQAIQNLVSLYSSNTPTRLLLKMMIEYYQIELGTDI